MRTTCLCRARRRGEIKLKLVIARNACFLATGTSRAARAHGKEAQRRRAAHELMSDFVHLCLVQRGHVRAFAVNIESNQALF